MTEQWREWGSNHLVSDQGRVARFLKPQAGNGGLLKIMLAIKPKVYRQKAIHQMVLEAFVGPRPEGMVTRHADGDPTNNRLENLCYGTQSENMYDMVAHGRHWKQKGKL